MNRQSSQLPLNSSQYSYLQPAQPGFYHLRLLGAGGRGMRVVVEYLEKAAEFDELARSIGQPALKKRYVDVAESFRVLAIVRRRLMETDALNSEQP
jgi:hypothetical protein